ncbi:hypothetical protein Hanom_Chr12g01096921 [Helianthus anomalus]
MSCLAVYSVLVNKKKSKHVKQKSGKLTAIHRHLIATSRTVLLRNVEAILTYFIIPDSSAYLHVLDTVRVTQSGSIK